MKEDLVVPIMSQTNHYREKKVKKRNWINERLTTWENNDRVCCIDTKNLCRYLTDNNDKDEKTNGAKNCVMKRILKKQYINIKIRAKILERKT